MGHVTLTTSLKGTICHRLGFVMFNVCTTFEISTFVHSEDGKGDAECRKWGGLWYRVGVIHGHLQCHHSIEPQHIRLPIPLSYRNYLVPFLIYCKLFVESRINSLPPRLLAPSLGSLDWNFIKTFAVNQTSWATMRRCPQDDTFRRFDRWTDVHR